MIQKIAKFGSPNQKTCSLNPSLHSSKKITTFTSSFSDFYVIINAIHIEENLMGFIIFFVVVLILVLAFKSSKKQETVTRVDKETGHTIVETRVTDTPSAGQTAARIVVWTVVGIVVLLLLLVMCSM